MRDIANPNNNNGEMADEQGAGAVAVGGRSMVSAGLRQNIRQLKIDIEEQKIIKRQIAAQATMIETQLAQQRDVFPYLAKQRLYNLQIAKIDQLKQENEALTLQVRAKRLRQPSQDDIEL